MVEDDDEKYHYMSKKHDNHYDYVESDQMGTLSHKEARESGLPYVYDKSKERKIYDDDSK